MARGPEVAIRGREHTPTQSQAWWSGCTELMECIIFIALMAFSLDTRAPARSLEFISASP